MMCSSNARLLAAYITLVGSIAQVSYAADILIADEKSQPESLTVAPGGTLIIGSASIHLFVRCSLGHREWTNL